MQMVRRSRARGHIPQKTSRNVAQTFADQTILREMSVAAVKRATY
jgi:hypothetical protein